MWKGISVSTRDVIEALKSNGREVAEGDNGSLVVFVDGKAMAVELHNPIGLTRDVNEAREISYRQPGARAVRGRGPAPLQGHLLPHPRNAIRPDVEVDREGRLVLSMVVDVDSEMATQDKGYPHPGNLIRLPDHGGTIRLQYGHPGQVGRNGCFMIDVLRACRENLAVYQVEGHPMASPETDQAIAGLDAAISAIESRKKDREARSVHQTDNP